MTTFFKSELEIENLLEPHKVLRLAVSGDVDLTELEVKIIDTPQYQRLRGYRQLGTSYLVYPSAQHTRFEHSIGVLRETQRLIDHIENNSRSEEREREIGAKEKVIIRLAALLHDIGNLPHGHTLEDETNVVQSYQEDRKRYKHYIGPDTRIGQILQESIGAENREILMDVLTEDISPEKKFMSDIVKNTVCADLIDYLKRDNYLCGLSHDMSSRFLRYIFIHEDIDGNRRLAVRLWGDSDDRPRAALISELIQLLQERYFLAERVYFHHTRRKFSAMLGAAVWHAMNAEDDALSLEDIREKSDDELIADIRNTEEYPSSARKIAKHIDERKPYRRIYYLQRSEFEPEGQGKGLSHIKDTYHSDPSKRSKVEQEIEDLCNLEKGDIIIYCPDPDMNFKPADMRVTWGDRVRKLKNIDDPVHKERPKSIVRSHEKLWQLEVFIRDGALKNSYTSSDQQEELIKACCRVHFKDEGYEYLRTLLVDDIDGEVRSEGHHSHLIREEREELKNHIRPERGGDISRSDIKERMIDMISSG